MRRSLLSSTMFAGLLLAAPAVAQTITTPPVPYQYLVPLNNFGVSASNTAAQNTAAFNAAVAAGNTNFSLKATGGFPYLFNTITMTTGLHIEGEDKTVVIQPAAGTCAFIMTGKDIYLGKVNIAWATAQASNAASYGLCIGNAISDPVLLQLNNSIIDDVTVTNSSVGLAYQSQYLPDGGNLFNKFHVINASYAGIYFQSAGNASSLFNDTIIEGPSAATSTANCYYGVFLNNIWNVQFNGLQFNNLNCSANTFYATGSSASINYLSFSGVYRTTGNLFQVASNSSIEINGASVTYSTFSGSTQVFAMLGGSVLNLSGFYSGSNTTSTPVAMFTDDGSAAIYAKGLKFATSNFVVNTRGSLAQYEQYTFDTPGGRIRNGLVGTAAPSSGGLPSPFLTTAGVALPYAVGDRVNNTAPTSTTTTGWINTTAGSPGTWTAEPVL